MGSERVPRTNLKNSGMNASDIELASVLAICLNDDRNAI